MLDSSNRPLEEKEYPDEADLGEDEETLGLAPCPACGELMYEDAPRCPYCGEWIVGRGSWRDSRKWYVRGGLYLTKTLLLNWIFWIGVSAVAAAAILMRLLK